MNIKLESAAETYGSVRNAFGNSTQKSLVVFTLDEQRYALDLSAVERIVWIVEITPLPKGPGIVLGVVNVRGQVIPVVDIRKRFRLPARAISLRDHLLIARAGARTVALLVDAVVGVVECGEEAITRTDGILPKLEYIESVVRLEDGLMLIHNLDTFLSLAEEKTLERALAPASRQDP